MATKQKLLCKEPFHNFAHFPLKLLEQISLEVMRKALADPQGSKILMKLLTSAAVSSVLYHRVDFDRTDFEQHSMGECKYYTFKSNVKNTQLSNIKLRMCEIADAISNGYLKEFDLDFIDKKDRNTVLESYKVKYKYYDEDTEYRVLLNQLQETVTQMISALDRLSLLESRFSTDNIVIRMAMTYYKEITPVDYHPRFFCLKGHGKYNTELINKQPPIYYNIGIVRTNHHTLTSSGRGPVFDCREPRETFNIAEKQSMDVCMKNSVACQNMAKNVFGANSVPPNDINCFCKKNMDFNEISLVYCPNCKTWQHSPCAGFMSTDNIPPGYSCLHCQRKEQKQPAVFQYRLLLVYAYRTNTFPEEIMNTMTEEEQNFYKKKLYAGHVITETSEGYKIHKDRIELVSSAVFVDGSNHRKRLGQIPSSMTMESQKWSPVIGSPKTKRVKWQ